MSRGIASRRKAADDDRVVRDTNPENERPALFVCLRCHALYPAPGACPNDGAPLVLDRTDQVLAGRYRLKQPINLGGSGVLWEADQLALGRQVAVRIVPSHDAGASERVRRGAAVMARMAHPNIVTLHDFGEHDGRFGPELFLVTEHLTGVPLRRYTTRDRLPIEHVVSATVQTLRALEHVHRRGFIHRDIKPANLFVCTVDDEGCKVKLLDFGIARGTDAPGDDAEPGAEEARGKRRLTRQLQILGTPEYMAPEQILGQPLDARVDVYAVGVLLFSLLSGRLPFTGDDRMALYQAHLRAEIPDVSGLLMANPQGVAEWQGFFSRALAKSPDDRFASARAMRDALVRLPRVNLISAGA